MQSIIVVGAGVIGLTTAVVLAERGWKVVVVSKEKSGQTTSAVAAAFWYPYKAFPEEKVVVWGGKTFEEFEELATIDGTGVSWIRLVQVTDDTDAPWWNKTVRNFSYARPQELPAGRLAGIAFDTFVIDSSVYLTYLNQRLEKLGVVFVYENVDTLVSLFDKPRSVVGIADYLVNCSGLGARALAKDEDLHPARGQVVKIKKQPGDKPLLDAASPIRFSHCIPRTTDIVLGGTYEEGVEDSSPSGRETKSIIERCKLLMPRLASLTDSDILQVSCGFRPVRSVVRLEKEEIAPRKFIVHNYGHGGAGYTLSWGCAFDVFNLM
jgi:D-amino-acid oxidase